MSMNEDRFAGTARDVGGRVEQGLGRATGDTKTEIEGKMKHATGAAQDLYGQAKDAAGDAYEQAKEVAGDAARSVQQHAAPMEEFLRNAIEKSALYLGSRSARSRLVYRLDGQTFGLLRRVTLRASTAGAQVLEKQRAPPQGAGRSQVMWVTYRCPDCGLLDQSHL